MVIQAEVVPDIVEADLVAAVQETMEMVLVVMSDSKNGNEISQYIYMQWNEKSF